MSQPAIDFLQGVAAKNPDRNLRGQASFVLARLAKQWAESIAYAANSTNASDLEYLKACQKVAKAQTADEAFKKAEARFEEVIAKYASCPNFPAGPGLRNPKPKLGEQAAVELYECRNLELGRKAPDIEAKDLDGVKFKLSDYRGKVVMISFWATWCGPCMQMVPHEKELVERLKGRPFVLVGVNGDDRTAAAKKVVEQEGMTWRSFWNGGAWNGAISTAWNVTGWPTVYVLDAQGVIRYKLEGNGGKRTEAQLDEVIERWVSAAESAKP
jgi:thiol-disulfide isomerase/thioredoxin